LTFFAFSIAVLNSSAVINGLVWNLAKLPVALMKSLRPSAVTSSGNSAMAMPSNLPPAGKKIDSFLLPPKALSYLRSLSRAILWVFRHRFDGTISVFEEDEVSMHGLLCRCGRGKRHCKH
jgi:hypothetical protein